MTKQSVKLISLTEYYGQLLTLWNACFPEDADFGETFLQKAAPFTKIFGVCEDDVLVSCAYCLPATLYDGEKRFVSYYIYGVGTLPAYRGQGYAKDVLEYIRQAVACDVLFLYPAKPSLRTFYAGLGYLSVLYRAERMLPQSENGTSVVLKTPFVAEEYAQKRADFLKNKCVAYAVFENAVLQVLLSHAQMLSFDGGTALCVSDDETLCLPEILCETLPSLPLEDKPIIAYTAGTACESGMLLPCSIRAKAHFIARKKVPFFGTFFAE